MDCSKTTGFFAEAKRLCDSRAGLCDSRTACTADAANKERCPLFDFCEFTYSKIYIEDAKSAVENLQKWSDEHSRKTYAQDFFEKFPDAPRCKSANGRYPSACRKSIYDGKCPHGVVCEECWNELMEE